MSSFSPNPTGNLGSSSLSISPSQVKMNITIDKAHVKECVMYTLRKRFSDFRSKAHTYYKKLGGGNMARQKPFKELSERLEDWLWSCDYFDSDTFKKKSESNSQNRSKLKFVHRMGTRSLVAHQYDQKLSRIELYKEEFTDKEKKWVSEECKTNYDNMIEIRQKVINEGATPDETIICAEVLGETSSYIRGLGYGPKPIKKYKFVRSNEPSEREVELESNLKGIQERFEEQSKIIKTQQRTIDWLKAIAEKMGMQPPVDDGSGDGTLHAWNVYMKNEIIKYTQLQKLCIYMLPKKARFHYITLVQLLGAILATLIIQLLSGELV